MATREAFLAKVREAQPAARPRPEVPLFASQGGDLRARFAAALQAMGGTCVDVSSAADVPALLAHVRAGTVPALAAHFGETVT